MLTGLAQEAFDTLDPSYLRELEKSRRKLDIDKASELLADWPDLPCTDPFESVSSSCSFLRTVVHQRSETHRYLVERGPAAGSLDRIRHYDEFDASRSEVGAYNRETNHPEARMVETNDPTRDHEEAGYETGGRTGVSDRFLQNAFCGLQCIPQMYSTSPVHHTTTSRIWVRTG